MALGRTPVAMKTALARKYSGKYALEMAHIEAIDLGKAGLLPGSVNSAIADSHARIKSRRVQKLGETAVAFDLFKATGNISQFLEAVAELPPMPYTI